MVILVMLVLGLIEYAIGIAENYIIGINLLLIDFPIHLHCFYVVLFFIVFSLVDFFFFFFLLTVIFSQQAKAKQTN